MNGVAVTTDDEAPPSLTMLVKLPEGPACWV